MFGNIAQIINGKPAERRLGDWAQMKSSKGKVYYFHLKTQVSQWVEPAEWKQLEERERGEEEEALAARAAFLQGRTCDKRGPDCRSQLGGFSSVSYMANGLM